jgi:hypothetical protein
MPEAAALIWPFSDIVIRYRAGRGAHGKAPLWWITLIPIWVRPVSPGFVAMLPFMRRSA